MNRNTDTRGRGPIMAKNRPHDPGKNRSPKTPVYSGVNDEFLAILFEVVNDPLTLNEVEKLRLQSMIQYGTNEEREAIDDMMLKFRRSEVMYKTSINDLNQTAHGIKDNKDPRMIGGHRLLSSDSSKLMVEPGTLKHGWMIQFNIAKSYEKDMLTAWNKLTSTIDDIEDRKLLKLGYVKCDCKQHTMVLDHIEWEAVETNSICFIPELHVISFMVPEYMRCEILQTRLKVGAILQVRYATCDYLKMETTMEMKSDNVSYVMQVISNFPRQKKMELDKISYVQQVIPHISTRQKKVGLDILSRSRFSSTLNNDRKKPKWVNRGTASPWNSYFKKKGRRSYKRKKKKIKFKSLSQGFWETRRKFMYPRRKTSYKRKKKKQKCNEDFQSKVLFYERNGTQKLDIMVLSVMALMLVIGSRIKPKEDANNIHNALHGNPICLS